MENDIHKRARISRSARHETPIMMERLSILGPNCFMGAMSYLSEFTVCGRGTRIGRYCSIARAVNIGAVAHPTHFLSTHPFQYRSYHFGGQPEYEAVDRVPFDEGAGVTIGHDVWIGANALILRGVTIGTGAVIGGNALVNKDVPPYAIVVGSPASVLRYRFDELTIERLLASRWWNRPFSEVSDLPFDDIAAALDMLEAMPPAPEDGA